MKKQNLPLVKYSLLCSLLLSTAAIAMDPPQPQKGLPLRTPLIVTTETIEEQKIMVPLRATNFPPVITYRDLVSILMKGGEIEGWGKMDGDIETWLEKPKNKAFLRDKDGVDLEDLTFFQEFKLSINEATRQFECIYTLPYPRYGNGPYFCLRYDASSGKIAASNQITEDVHIYLSRLAAWKREFKEKRAYSRGSCQQPDINALDSPPAVTVNVPQIEEREADFNYPKPPFVTYDDLVSSLMVNVDVDGWGNMTGNICTWLQNPNNRSKLTDKDGVDLENLFFFHNSIPDVDQETKKLSCKYTLPIFNEEYVPCFILYRNASPEEMLAVIREKERCPFFLETLPNTQLYTQFHIDKLNAWNEGLKEKQNFTKVVETEMMSDSFIPGFSYLWGNFDYSFNSDNQNNPRNFMYLNIDYNKVSDRVKYYNCSDGHEMNMLSVNTLKGRLCLKPYTKSEEILNSRYCLSFNNLIIDSKSLDISDCLFSNPNTFFSADNVVLKRGYFKVQEAVKFSNSFPACPIKSIRLEPANIRLPMVITGTVQFIEKPQINLHVLNVKAIRVKTREN